MKTICRADESEAGIPVTAVSMKIEKLQENDTRDSKAREESACRRRNKIRSFGSFFVTHTRVHLCSLCPEK